MSERATALYLFAYGALLAGESQQDKLQGCRHVANVTTLAKYRLVDLGPYPALINGMYEITGEIYQIDLEVRRQLDVFKEHPRLFHRVNVELNWDTLELVVPAHVAPELHGARVETYLMAEELVRGRRRLRVNDWRKRFAPAISATSGGRLRRLR